MSIWQIGESGTEIPLNDNGQGEVSFTVTNNGPTQDRAMLTITPLDGAAKEWFTVPEPQKAVVATQSVTYVCKVAVPPGTPPATYALEAVVYSADSTPDETSTKSRRVTFVVAPKAAPTGGRKIPWWIFLIIGLVVLAAIVGVLVFILGGDDDDDTTGTTVPQPAVSNVEAPTITGTPQVGALLEADTGTWTLPRSQLTPSFQWERCTGTDDTSCEPIDQARTAQYLPAPEDEGASLRVVVGVRVLEEDETDATITTVVTTDEDDAPAATATSEPTGAVAPSPEPEPQAVPQVVNLTVSAATAALSPPFQVALLTAGDPVFTCDPIVEDQDPDGGTLEPPGTKVTLSVRPTGFIFCGGIILDSPIFIDDDFAPGLLEVDD